MTNKEIDKLLDMVSKNDLLNIKKYLLKEKRKNDSILRQKTFEKYLTNNIGGLNDLTIPSIHSNDNNNTVQIFTNFASIYILNKKILNMGTSNLSFEKNRARKTSHRFKIVSKDEINKFINKFEKYLNSSQYDVLSIECWSILKNDLYDIEYFDEEKQEKMTEKFLKREIDTADIILDNPKYTIYNDIAPILKAESNIGKCYILGCKK